MIMYLASPYSHPDPAVREQRYRSALAAAGKLMASGAQVFAPIVYSHTMATSHDLPLDWEYWREFDLAMLSRCDELLVLKLDGWDTSIGVAAEVERADELGLQVRYIYP